MNKAPTDSSCDYVVLKIFEFACCYYRHFFVGVWLLCEFCSHRLVVLRRSVRMLASAWTAQHGIYQAKDVVSGWIVKVACCKLICYRS